MAPHFYTDAPCIYSHERKLMSEKPRFTILEDRGLLAVSGSDRVSFLQGLVSNDVEKAGSGRAVYAALLTPQGKYLHDFFMIQINDVLFLDCERAGLDGLKKKLSLYKLRADVALEDRSEDFTVAALFATGTPEAPDLGSDSGGVAYPDPRLASAGARAILPRETAETVLGQAGFEAAPFEDYDRLRLGLGLPDASRDLIADKSILLESGFDELNGVDWDKGCYMGQELTARTKYRGLVKKRLMPVSVDGPLPQPGTPILLDGREAGEMRSGNDGLGLALMRLEALEKAAESGGAFTAGEATLTPSKPDWVDF